MLGKLHWVALTWGAHLVIVITSAMLAGGEAYAGAVARVYLVGLAFVAAAYRSSYGDKLLWKWWRHTGLVVAMAGIAGYLAVVFGAQDALRWTGYFPDYPYFGEVYRLRGPASVYGMLYMLLLPALLSYYQRWRKGRGRKWPVILILLACLLTFSKENLLFPIGALLLEMKYRPCRRVVLGTMAASLTLILFLLTHFLIIPPGASIGSYLGEVSFGMGEWRIGESVYVPIKRAAWNLWRDHPWFGIGPGRFATLSVTALPPTDLPVDFGPFDPHGTWTGALAETGILGLVTLGGGALVHAWYVRSRSAGNVVPTLLVLFLIASFFRDVEGYRILWILGGLGLVGRSHADGGPVTALRSNSFP